jgi:hypothetical protein
MICIDECLIEKCFAVGMKLRKLLYIRRLT